VDHLCQFAAKSVHLFSFNLLHKFDNGRTDTDGRTDGHRQTDR